MDFSLLRRRRLYKREYMWRRSCYQEGVQKCRVDMVSVEFAFMPSTDRGDNVNLRCPYSEKMIPNWKKKNSWVDGRYLPLFVFFAGCARLLCTTVLPNLRSKPKKWRFQRIKIKFADILPVDTCDVINFNHSRIILLIVTINYQPWRK